MKQNANSQIFIPYMHGAVRISMLSKMCFFFFTSKDFKSLVSLNRIKVIQYV